MGLSMRIGICDDEMILRDKMYLISEETASKESIEAEFVFFSNGDEAYEDDTLDILLLDIEMPGMDGIQVKERYQMDGRNTIIIFVTVHPELCMEAFGINVIGFVEKDQIEISLPKTLSKIFRMMNQYVVLGNGINSRNIVYIKSDYHYANLYLKSGEHFIERNSLGNLEKELGAVGFFRVNRTYLVNLGYVEKMENNVITIAGTCISVSSRKRKAFREAFHLYRVEHAR
jgi:DNA-binding LytR/AlgR family response regulator